MEKKFVLPEYGYEVILGKFANQADGAAWFQQGGTVILSTVVTATSDEFPGFLPLTIDYREQYAAAGKIPGGYFKREGKFSDKEILVSRLIDRAVRPLFPTHFFNQIQILATVYSVDKKYPPYALALLASSIALTTSKIPFLGPVGAVELGRIDKKWIINPTYEQTLQSDAKITVAGTEEGITMVEGRTNQISEIDFIDALFLAHKTIKEQVEWQKLIVADLGVAKEEVVDQFDWGYWDNKVNSFLTDERIKSLFIYDKVKRNEVLSEIKDTFFKDFESDAEEQTIPKTFLEYIFNDNLKKKLTKEVFALNKRIDGRNFDEIRPILVEVGLLPFNHGSAFFQRGRTQALVSVTLGGGQDEQRIEDIMHDTIEKSFILHYNFPPFSVGEVRPMRGPGRREVGHGYLAASAFKYVLPSSEDFPYTIRVVADMLGSDGSTSMATVCGATMSLMNAGIPISQMVSGIAMGLMRNEEDGSFKVLSDIIGMEDAFGLMDFKVAGTEIGITAIQMDIKYKGGLHRSIFEKALDQAKQGRLYILNEMRKVMSAPSPKLSDLVPQIVSFRVPKHKIGAIIGKGGETIRKIIDETGTSIDIEEDGLVKVFGQPGPKLDQAISWVKILGGQVDKGSICYGRIRKIADFGVFVEVAPGYDGLVHESNMPPELKDKFQKVLKVDDPVVVEVLDFDEYSGRIRLKLKSW